MELFEGLIETLQVAIQERIARLLAYCRSLPVCGAPQTFHANRQCEIYNNCSQLERLYLMQNTWSGNDSFREGFLEAIQQGIQVRGKSYIPVILGLSDKQRESGTAWLQGIIDHIVAESLQIFPSLASGLPGE
jgi:UDP-N-acetylglucosamine/UDP-N-acetylgalactosamine diphosphorylase